MPVGLRLVPLTALCLVAMACGESHSNPDATLADAEVRDATTSTREDSGARLDSTVPRDGSGPMDSATGYDDAGAVDASPRKSLPSNGSMARATAVGTASARTCKGVAGSTPFRWPTG